LIHNLEKIDVILTYDEARGRSELARQIYGETFVNVVQHLRDFGCFECISAILAVNENIALVAEEILHEIKNHLRTSTKSQIICSKNTGVAELPPQRKNGVFV
jgi:GGDEF domain-containing protein